MDDLLDLNWSGPSSNAPQQTKQPNAQQQQPKDAFADLLSQRAKPVDVSKLSLAEQQRMQQQQRQEQQPIKTTSPWMTPIQASKSVSSPKPASQHTRSPNPVNAFLETTKQSSSSTASFENLLDPFGSNKKQSDKNTPLNQLRNQTGSAAVSPNNSNGQWDFDLLNSKLASSSISSNSSSTNQDHGNVTVNNNNIPASNIDPFDMDSLLQQEAIKRSPQPSASSFTDTEDDNPLGILADPLIHQEDRQLKQDSPASQSPAISNNKVMLDWEEEEEEDNSMIYQLVEMGFSLHQAKFAIEATGGSDLQAAIDLLVQNPETVSKNQSTEPINRPRQSESKSARRSLFDDDRAGEKTASPRSRQNQSQETQPRQHRGTSPAKSYPIEDSLHQHTEKIVSQAQELGGFLYKNAASYLTMGRQKVAKAVGDWQEQQRAQRLQEQSGKPRWMTEANTEDDVPTENNIEKFVDDADSDNEQDLQAERQKIQEMRKEHEQKRKQAAEAHKTRQQEKLKKDTLIDEGQTYVSPSRRRNAGTSGNSTPRSSQSPKPAPVPAAVPVKPKENKRTRPVINASADIVARANEARSQGNEKFKLGQFGEAEESYTRAINILPTGHDHHVLLYNNRAMARLKTGDYRKCIEDCEQAILMAKQSGDVPTSSETVTIHWRDQIIKSLYRKAEALENAEKYKDALSTFEELTKYEGTGNLKVNQGMSRCRQALNPKRSVSIPSKSPSTPASSSAQNNFMSMFDPAADNTSNHASSPVVSHEELSKSKAVAAMRAKAAEKEAQDTEKLEKTDDVNARLNAWKAGKEQNLRALLATLDTLLWPGAQWKGAQISELINEKKCKITYMKAIAKVHPDKLPSNVTVEQSMLASGIFASLNEAWDAFKSQNNL